MRSKVIVHSSSCINSHQNNSNQTSIVDYAKTKAIDLHLYHWCLLVLEDFMILSPKSKGFIIVPTSHHISKDECITPTSTEFFYQKEYEAHLFTVHSNIKEKYISNGMLYSNAQHGIASGNYSVTFIYDSLFDGTKYTQLITWNHVLNSGMDGIQV